MKTFLRVCAWVAVIFGLIYLSIGATIAAIALLLFGIFLQGECR